MPRKPARPDALAGKIFLGRDAVAHHLITRDALRSSAWRRVFRGVYADATLPDTHRSRCLAAAAFLIPKGAAIAGRSAATLYGAGLAEAGDQVEVVVPPSARFGPAGGLRIHTAADLLDDEFRRIGQMAVTNPVRTCWDLAQWLAPVEAVVIIDRILGAGLVTRAVLEAYAESRAGSRGAQRFGRVLALADGRAGSPQESRLRVRLRGARIPVAHPQYAVYDEQGFVARVDLAWPELRIAVEYDGLWHVGSAGQMHRDRRRLNLLAAAGWLVMHVTSVRLRDDFDGVLAELRAAIRSRS